MSLIDILRKVELFNGLGDSELRDVEGLCVERRLHRGEIITTQGKHEDELFIVTQGFIEIILGEAKAEPRKIVVNLGEGQIIGEMSLVDQGPRSATARAAVEATTVQAISCRDFEVLCERNAHIGYMVMRNIASDLSFKLRHRNLSEGGR